MEDSLQCSKCGKSFAFKKGLKAHYQDIHGVMLPSPPKTLVCGACSSRFSRIEEFEEHIRDEHDFTTTVEYQTFESKPAFLQWKREIERTNPVKFVTRNSKTAKGNRTVYYRCNRAGPVRFRVPPEEKKRKVKSQGSSKTNLHCPARITATFHSDGSVEACFCLSHFGHPFEVGHTPLPSPTKKAIAAKIASCVPLDSILNDVRKILRGELTRDHFLNHQDSKNIMRDFQLDCDYKLHQDDAMSVEGWIQQEQQSHGDESSVILYKAKGVDSSDNPSLKTSEFLLGIMTPGQGEILKKFGANVVCMESTHGMTGYGYEMTTLLVLDEFGEGFPGAFFISDRDDHIGIEIFLKAIKDRVGNLTAKVFMSDMAENFYNAWKAVMGPSGHRLYCTWHVLRAWHKKISALKMEKRDQVSKQVRILLTETDVEAFKEMLPSTIATLCSDADTVTFGDYFQTYYAANCEKWAYCFRVNAGINTNMALERVHGVLKHIFMKGTAAKRMDKTINAVMRMVNDKLFNKLIALQKGKVSHKIRELRQRHRIAMQLSLDHVIPNQDPQVKSWSVFSFTTTDSYVVSLVGENCDCAIRCEHCNACFHKFTCTCIDYCIKSNICKHVHLVCQFLSVRDQNETDKISERNKLNSPIDTDPQLIIDMGNKKEHESQLLIDLLSKPRDDYLTETLQNLEAKFSSSISECTSQVEVDIVKQTIRTMEAKLAAVRKENIPVNSQTKKKVDVRKKIEPQRKFTLKKKMKKRQHMKQTSEETMVLAAQACLPGLGLVLN